MTMGPPCMCDHGKGHHEYGHQDGDPKKPIVLNTPCQVHGCKCKDFVPASEQLSFDQ